MGPVSQPSQSASRSRRGSGRAVGDLPVERRGTARPFRLERRGEGALGRGAVGRAPLPGSLSRRVQRQPRRLRPAKAPEERHQVPRGALQGQQQEVQRAREEHHHQQHQHGDESTLVNNFICHLTFSPLFLLFHIPSLDLPGAQALFKTNSCRFSRLESSGVVTRSHLLHCILNLRRIEMWHSLLNL